MPDERGATDTTDVMNNGVRRCVGTVRSTGERCKRNPGPWKTQCSKHGGNAPQTRKAAARRQHEALALRELTKQGITHIEDPVAAQLDIASRLYTLVEILESKVAEVTTISSYDMKGTEQISAVLAAYESALTKTGQALNSINKLDLLERQYASTQAEAKRIVEAVRSGVYGAGSGLTYDAAQLVFGSIAEELQKVFGSSR